ncbi:OmpH family outer membrane protein [Labilibaculum sp. DW002]|jgi:outer membrane protein|uniref:OmpH family outer membrane protein n=1 Tax=Paralabilibaculum antarcticum TaxID=2912572 RepID=A0ABT5VRL5_9BACT|nr:MULTISPECIES: OmpH family outer membrane protein [unclassified Labilibaculum]MBI9056479.1 OmpH family outer membrane protein [Labilibaculum sp.]MDE5418072.1 OmpH family outer membrane protein [Labilibaculum sp. DW002]
MKRLVLLIGFVFVLVGSLYSQQRYGFVDTEYILNKMPDYKNAQEQLDQISSNWQIEIEKIAQEIKELQTKFRADEVFLSSEMRQKREKEIFNKELLAQKLQQKYFGRNGELYKKRQELMKPIQDDIYDAIKEIAKAGTYGMIIDRANGPTIIYSSPKFDLSDKVLYKLGIRTN